MNRLATHVIAAALTIAAADGAAARAPVNALSDKSVSDQLLQSTKYIYETRLNGGDKARLGALFADDLVFVEEIGTVSSKIDILNDISAPSAKQIKFEISNWSVTARQDLRVATYKLTLHLVLGGQTVPYDFQCDEIWHLNNGRLEMVSGVNVFLVKEPPAAILPADMLRDYAGVYRAGDRLYTIKFDGKTLTGALDANAPKPLVAESRDTLFIPGNYRQRRIFQRDETGKITGFVLRREGHDFLFTRDPSAG